MVVKKYSLSIQVYVEALAKPKGVVLDAYAFMGIAFSHLCINPCIVCFFLCSIIYNCYMIKKSHV